MKLEKLDTNNKKLKLAFILGVIITASFFILINFLTSRAKYQKTESIQVVSGTINYKVPDLNIIAMYKDGTETTTMPGKGYTIDQSQSYCYTTNANTHDTSIKLSTDSEGNLVIGGLKKGSKCILYFVKDPIQDIIASSKGTVSDFSKTACDNGTNSSGHTSGNCDIIDKGIYEAEDDYGTSYYYRGTVDNNWVKFAGYWWRIIRINGNGSIRMIYSGNAGTKPTDGRWSDKGNSQTATSAYNASPNYKDNTYVGFYTGTVGSSATYETAHNNSGGPSTIATYLNGWYASSGLNSYASKLDGTTGWCNDRGVDSTYETGKAYGTNYAGYQPRYRLDTKKSPILTCTTKSRDLFTTSDTTSATNNGNKKLSTPIGLITADEVAMAGGVYSTNNYGYYLYTGKYYWTMSPCYFSGSNARVLLVHSTGLLYNGYVNTAYDVRPVINLKAGTTLVNNGTGEKGTIVNPYEVL